MTEEEAEALLDTAWGDLEPKMAAVTYQAAQLPSNINCGCACSDMSVRNGGSVADSLICSCNTSTVDGQNSCTTPVTNLYLGC